MSAQKPARRRKKGFAIILTTLTLFVTGPLVGLAIDLSILYFIRTRLSTALDAAVLAGARALGQGATPALQAANAQAAAQRFFNANFPSGFWGTSSPSFSPPIVDDTSTPNYRSVTATASVQAPLYFMRLLGQTSSIVAASARAARRDAIVVLVLDRSGSMNWSMGGMTACDAMKSDAVDFLSNFALGRDQVGLVVFDSNVYAVPPSKNFSNLSTDIENLTCGGHTGTALALATAYAQMRSAAIDATTANIIVLETDGRPNSFDADFTGLRAHPGTCDPTSAPLVGEIGPQGDAPTDTGGTIGVMAPTVSSITTVGDSAADNSFGCVFGPPGSSNQLPNMRNEIASMPAKDAFGNDLAGNYSVLNPNFPYNGQIVQLLQVYSPRQIIMAAVNALDNEATTIRLDAKYKITLMTIGLEGTAPGDPPDTLLLRKVANDPTMKDDPDATARSFYNLQKDQTPGFFALAPSPEQLGIAFNQIATQIVIRLSR